MTNLDLDLKSYGDFLLFFSIFAGIVIFVVANVNYLPTEEKDGEEK